MGTCSVDVIPQIAEEGLRPSICCGACFSRRRRIGAALVQTHNRRVEEPYNLQKIQKKSSQDWKKLFSKNLSY
jgi:hypothetical protein